MFYITLIYRYLIYFYQYIYCRTWSDLVTARQSHADIPDF